MFDGCVNGSGAPEWQVFLRILRSGTGPFCHKTVMSRELVYLPCLRSNTAWSRFTFRDQNGFWRCKHICLESTKEYQTKFAMSSEIVTAFNEAQCAAFLWKNIHLIWTLFPYRYLFLEEYLCRLILWSQFLSLDNLQQFCTYVHHRE